MATVLVIDDERMMCELLKAVLARHGHEIIMAFTGRDGIALFKQHRPRITLLDLVLPDMNGIQVLQEIRAIDPHAPALIDRKSTRLNSSHGYISYAVFCLKKK